jgi:hypothetical protein
MPKLTADESASLERALEKIAEPVPASLATALTAAELDQQITTARKYPRSIKRFLSEAHDLVTWSVEVAEECIYAVPRDKKIIRGPSARFAEVLLSRYSNCRVSSRVVDESEQWVTAQGIFHDLETNAATAYEVRRRITDSKGRKYSLDMIGVTANAACSIAMRQAILKGIPKAIWSDVYAAAERTIAGDNRPLDERRDNALAHFKRLGVAPDRVYAALGISGLADLSSDHLLTLQGIKQALRDGELKIDDAFPPLAPPTEAGLSRTEQLKKRLAATAKESAPPPPGTAAPDAAGGELPLESTP